MKRRKLSSSSSRRKEKDEVESRRGTLIVEIVEVRWRRMFPSGEHQLYDQLTREMNPIRSAAVRVAAGGSWTLVGVLRDVLRSEGDLVIRSGEKCPPNSDTNLFF